jgi:GT2 family glycosyltransferase/tetratricopeptide (TPR) repeat protein
VRTVSAPGSRPAATVVILAWNAWAHTRACLDSLQPTIRPDDQVVVVDNGSSDGTGVGLTQYRWLEVVTNPDNRGFAPGCNQGAAMARGEMIVFLNNDTLVSDGWLDELLAPFADGAVGATGPRSNNVSGPQRVDDAPAGHGDAPAIDGFARQWRRANTGRVSQVGRLVGFCLAVRRDVFEAVGGFDEGYTVGGFEDDDLCMKIAAAGHRLLVAHGSFVHHEAHVTFDANHIGWEEHQLANQHRFESKWGGKGGSGAPFLSVCLIVKDEEEMLPDCLGSVAEVADEIVVYDTGSTDRTVEIARAAGAVVIEGYWDESFARARNAALAHATGEWVLSIDADEMLFTDPRSLKAHLWGVDPRIEAHLVAIENLHGAGHSRSVHTAIRMFRRRSCSWRHRLHEQVVAADDPSRALVVSYLSGSRILHRGYVAEAFEAKNKAERNLAIARAALEDEDVSRPYALMNYGRTLELAGESDEAIESLLEAIETSQDPVTTRLALRNLINILGRHRRFDEALDKVVALRGASVAQIAADIAEGQVRIAMGDAEAGLDLLAHLPDRGRDDDGMEYAAHMVAAMRGEALASLGRFGEAADVVLDAIRTDGVLEADLGELTSWLLRARRQPSEIAGALEVADLMPVLGRSVRLDPATADLLLEGFWEQFPGRLEPLAAAARIGPRLPVARALVWSARLRRQGLASACPLVVMARDEGLDPRVRIRAAAAAFGSFGERAIVEAAHDARSRLDSGARGEVDDEIGRLAPGLLEAARADAAPVDAARAGITTAVSAPGGPIIAGTVEVGWHPSLAVSAPVVAARPRRRGINVVGPVGAASAEGELTRTLATTLRSIGVEVSTTSYDPDRRSGSVEWEHRDPGDHPFDTTLLTVPPERVGDYVIDNGRQVFEGRYIMAVWLWDFDAPSAAMGTAARAVHEIWVPSAFAARAVAQVTDLRVSTMALPAGLGSSRVRDRSGRSPSEFVFLTPVDFDTGFARQNPLGVVDSFCSAFAPGEGPRLVIETSHSDRHPRELAALSDAVDGRSDISVVDAGEEDPRRRAPEIAGADCLVSLHRSDGSGLLLARAMASGTPTIATSYGANTEFQGERDAFLVPFGLEPVPQVRGEYPVGARWAVPDQAAAALAMRRVVEDPRAASAKARRARERARREFTPSRAARAIRDRAVTIDRRRHGDGSSSRGPVAGHLASSRS